MIFLSAGRYPSKPAHALMVDTLRSVVEDALARQQFYANGEASYHDTLHSNAVFSNTDVKAYVLARAKGGKPTRPNAQRLDVTKPMSVTHG